MIRVGICGCANIAQRSLIPAFAAHPSFELAAVGSRSLEKAAEVAAQYGCVGMTYEELVSREDLDLIYVPLPNGLHFEWVSKCLRAGKHVLCEKSLACSFEDVRQLVSLARENHCFLMESFQFRFHKQHRYVKQLLDEGVIGAVRCFRSSFGFPPFKDAGNIRYQRALGGGALLDVGAYTVKATTFMLGSGFRVRAATLWLPAGAEVDLGGSIYLGREDGVVSETAFGFDSFYQCNYEIWGSQGKITAKRAFTAPPGFEPEVVVETAGGVQVGDTLADDHFRNLLTHVSAAIHAQDFEAEYQECLSQARLLQDTHDCATGLRDRAEKPKGIGSFQQ